tara:strand:- start:337 stop:438 length:102 start_codon:yes stop_codon:yes gene_type:complete
MKIEKMDENMIFVIRRLERKSGAADKEHSSTLS